MMTNQVTGFAVVDLFPKFKWTGNILLLLIPFLLPIAVLILPRASWSNISHPASTSKEKEINGVLYFRSGPGDIGD